MVGNTQTSWAVGSYMGIYTDAAEKMRKRKVKMPSSERKMSRKRRKRLKIVDKLRNEPTGV